MSEKLEKESGEVKPFSQGANDGLEGGLNNETGPKKRKEKKAAGDFFLFRSFPWKAGQKAKTGCCGRNREGKFARFYWATALLRAGNLKKERG